MKHKATNDDEKRLRIMILPIAWKTNGSTMHVVRMFYKSWTLLFQNLGFETARINMGWCAQWKVGPWTLNKSVLKLFMRPYLHLDDRQRGRQARRYPLRTSNIEMFSKLLLQLQNQRKQSLLSFISHEMMMQVMPKAQDMKFILSRSPFCDNVIQIPDRALPELRFWKSPGEVLL